MRRSEAVHARTLRIAGLRAQALASRIELGPYSIAVIEVTESAMPVRRRHACLDLTHDAILIRVGLSPVQWLRALVHALVRLVHYSQAVLLHDSTEEHLTHSLASGLSQFARRNPQLCWALMRATHPPLRRGAARPQRLVLGEASWTVRMLPLKTAARLRLFGQADLERRRIEIDPALTGTQLAVIFLHETLHGLHHEHGVTDLTPLRVCHTREAEALLRFIALNPQAAVWWFEQLQAPRAAKPSARGPAEVEISPSPPRVWASAVPASRRSH